MTSMIGRATRIVSDARDGSLMARRRFRRVQAQIESVEGWLVPGQEYWLFATALALRDGARIVEVGSFKGRSTVSLGHACVGTRKHVFAIDRWQGLYEDFASQPEYHDLLRDGFFDIWSENIARNGLRDYVTPLVGNSTDVARSWRAPIDMLFVDGSHQYDDVVADFESFYPYVVPGGILAFHDVTPEWEGSYRAWHQHIAPRLSRHGAYSTISFGHK